MTTLQVLDYVVKAHTILDLLHGPVAIVVECKRATILASKLYLWHSWLLKDESRGVSPQLLLKSWKKLREVGLDFLIAKGNNMTEWCTMLVTAELEMVLLKVMIEKTS
ncbi:hypothetical protein HETIRDRAFT_429445 [Heterobasidion irregulare TC 32-1]|uniref:Uncharacterized protein n=1 Tax=Heterobasidion irregulare (strain TC 32-1) TaxID=747525 RepID=W4JU37_HETIT|nr:uncharacterized protein HETIRDRAFT_429445 [Heterobasidion irregulare TC 32-1]ETW77068.1 hypothetical protein HETIRDRAFT_429445 [Heterobasidion irregulare TC 32-1]